MQHINQNMFLHFQMLYKLVFVGFGAVGLGFGSFLGGDLCISIMFTRFDCDLQLKQVNNLFISCRSLNLSEMKQQLIKSQQNSLRSTHRYGLFRKSYEEIFGNKFKTKTNLEKISSKKN